MTRSEYTANEALSIPHARATEMARWAQVLARPAAARKPAAPRKPAGLLARLFNI